jgi:hypothetical protein
MFLHLRAGGGALWRPWYDSVRHGSLCFHDEQASLLCFVCVLYGKLLPRGKMRQFSFFAAGTKVNDRAEKAAHFFMHARQMLPQDSQSPLP